MITEHVRLILEQVIREVIGIRIKKRMKLVLFLNTGIFGACCARHEIPLMILDLQKG
jgi:hypothetical protein